MSTSSTAKTSTMRRTAATRVVLEDFDVPGLRDKIGAAVSLHETYALALTNAQQSYEGLRRETDELADLIAQEVIDTANNTGEKVSQAEIDRRIKSAQSNDERLSEGRTNLSLQKETLDGVVNDERHARYALRGLIAEAELVTASLGFMAASKQARAAALAELRDL